MRPTGVLKDGWLEAVHECHGEVKTLSIALPANIGVEAISGIRAECPTRLFWRDMVFGGINNTPACAGRP